MCQREVTFPVNNYCFLTSVFDSVRSLSDVNSGRVTGGSSEFECMQTLQRPT